MQLNINYFRYMCIYIYIYIYTHTSSYFIIYVLFRSAILAQHISRRRVPALAVLLQARWLAYEKQIRNNNISSSSSSSIHIIISSSSSIDKDNIISVYFRAVSYLTHNIYIYIYIYIYI